jgi:Cu(I)/Ag(I) efflux system membrane fusion protein
MKRLGYILAALVFLGIAFLAGYLFDRWSQSRTHGSTAAADRKILYYQDPMHPWYKSDKPGIAPDCGMKLVPIYSGNQSGNKSNDKSESQPANASTPAPPAGAIEISADRQQLMGVRYGVVESSPGVDSIRAVGKVAEDETRVTRVHAKVEGWIDRVFVDFTGDVVRKGQTLLTLYSPELLATQQEYLLALKARDVMHHSSMPEAAINSQSLALAARKRLELLDIPSVEVDELERTGKPVKSVAVYSPTSGYIMTRNAFASQRVTPETELYQIVDLSRVWIMADVFEADAPRIHVGQLAHISSPNNEVRPLTARVSYIQPQIDAASRTLKVRLDVPNPQNRLKPEAYLDVAFDVRTPTRLQVPTEAVLDTGAGKRVFLDRGNGFFEPRDVETGDRVGDQIQILKGLEAGQRIVVSAAFLLDSESQMKSATGEMGHSDSKAPVKSGEKAAPAAVPDMPGMAAGAKK